MARYTQDITLNKPEDFVQFMVNDFLQKQAYTLVDYKGEQVYRTGEPAFEGYKYMKWSYADGVFHLEAWMPTLAGKGESDLSGFVGALPKKLYKDNLQQLINLLQQDIPVPAASASAPNTNGAATEGSAPATGSAPIPVKTTDFSQSAIVSLCLGIVSIVAGCIIPLAGIILGCIAISMARGALTSSKAGQAKAGKICGIVGISIAAIGWILNIILSALNAVM